MCTCLALRALSKLPSVQLLYALCVPTHVHMCALCVPTHVLLCALCVPTHVLLYALCVPTHVLLCALCVPTHVLLCALCVPTHVHMPCPAIRKQPSVTLNLPLVGVYPCTVRISKRSLK
jgi:hypothetical protein